ncbi:hypothetical protein Dimus_024352 [Dionaea muscipula]
MNENGLTDLMSLIKGQKWERLFKRRELMYVAACKEFYKNLTVSISKRKEVARSNVRGVRIELDGMILAGILGIPENNGICEYIKENEEVADEGQDNQEDFDWEAVNEEAEIQGDSGSAEKFYDAENEVQGSADVSNEVPEVSAPVSDQQKEKVAAGVDLSVPIGSIPDPLLQHFQAEMDRARADRLQVELNRGCAENARLQALLHQAPPQPKP